MNRSQSGFTLVELLVVISIIGILAGFLFVNFAEIRTRGRDSRRKSDLSEIKKALRLYYNDHQQYPANSGSGQIQGCGADAASTCTWGSSFATADATYMTQLPTDPINAGSYVYAYEQLASGEDFNLTVSLENASDKQAIESQSRCGIPESSQVAGVYVVCGN